MQTAKQTNLMPRWRRYPLLFVKEVIGATPTNQQERALNDLGDLYEAKMLAAYGQPMDGRQKKLSEKFGISIVSGHGTGKDAWLSWVEAWLLACFPYSRGLVTAPTGHQLDDVLWPEIRSWLRKSKARLWEVIEIHSEKAFNKEHKNEWFVAKRTSSAKSSQEEQGETLAGEHADYMILAVDEASGVQDGVFKPFEGALTGKFNIGILIGNGTKNTGYFFDSHNKHRAGWICHQWSCEETNLDEITGTSAMALYVERMAKKYGRDSNYYRIRVKGEFPIAEPDALIPFEWIMSAVNREIEQPGDIPPVLGIDVARFGDDKSTIVPRRGNVVEPIKEFAKIDTMELVGWASLAIGEHEPAATFVDVIGLGAGVVDRLRELKYRVFGVNVSESAARDDKFVRLRDELWWKVREHFESRSISIPEDDELIGELSSLKFSVESNGKKKVEGKKEMKKRGLVSPNRADGLMLTYYMPDAAFRPPPKDGYDDDEDEMGGQGGWMSA